MLRQFKYQDITWIDLEAPTTEEVKQLAQDYNLPEMISQELVTPSLRPKADLYPGFIYLILHFPRCQICYGDERSSGQSDSQEIDFIIGKNFLITTHYELIDSLHELSKIFEIKPTWMDSDFKFNAGLVFFHIVKQMYSELAIGFDFINSRLKKAEVAVFAGGQREMVRALSDINRDMLDCRWALRGHHEVLESFAQAGIELFGEKFKHYPYALLGEYGKIWQMIESNRATFQDLRQTNESLLSVRTNEIMKTLAVTAFIFFPLTLITQIFSMNTHLPLVGSNGDFYFVLGLMAVVLGLMFTLAKNRQWL